MTTKLFQSIELRTVLYDFNIWSCANKVNWSPNQLIGILQHQPTRPRKKPMTDIPYKPTEYRNFIAYSPAESCNIRTHINMLLVLTFKKRLNVCKEWVIESWLSLLGVWLITTMGHNEAQQTTTYRNAGNGEKLFMTNFHNWDRDN